ncbi:MAG: hemolysin, partial [Clostridium sp.]|nr:hemolysin [Clostridium sp.]
VKEDEYIVDGSAKLDEISDLIGVNMESEELDSIGGLIIEELGRMPDENEEVNIGKIKFKVEEVEKNRIKKVRIYT